MTCAERSDASEELSGERFGKKLTASQSKYEQSKYELRLIESDPN
ncbi:MAG: hypothetical protein PHW19_11870 [Salinivirgaceae bacterium]|nr:hypothetical protein [Salinivirgaceae bacterium]